MNATDLHLLAQELHVKAAAIEKIPDDLEAYALGVHFRIVATEVETYADKKWREEQGSPRIPAEAAL